MVVVVVAALVVVIVAVVAVGAATETMTAKHENRKTVLLEDTEGAIRIFLPHSDKTVIYSTNIVSPIGFPGIVSGPRGASTVKEASQSRKLRLWGFTVLV